MIRTYRELSFYYARHPLSIEKQPLESVPLEATPLAIGQNVHPPAPRFSILPRGIYLTRHLYLVG